MLIDWFTVIAQIVNFLILVYLLKRFLYTPILNAIDEREKRIAAQLEDAASQKAEAQEERKRFEQMNEDLDQKKETLLKEAQADAEAERRRLLENARREYADLRKTLKETLNAEQSTLNHELKRRTQQEVFEIARKVLEDLAEATLESRIVTVFLQKLKALSKAEEKQMKSGFKTNGEPIIVRSAFDLPPEQQAALEQAVKKLLGADIQVQFRTSPEDVGGIELSAGGYKIAWTIAEYLDVLEKRIAALAEELPGRRAEPANKNHAD
jgi:F-type H+-transporting ATPase subunit b